MSFHFFGAFALIFFALLSTSPVTAQSFRPNELNGQDPVFRGGEWSMTLLEGVCASRAYGDGRGESDCSNGNIRSQLNGRRVNPPAGVEYSFDIFVPDGFRYTETLKYRTYGSLEIAEWQHTPGIKNHLFEMYLTPRNGIAIEGRTCISPSNFGRWNSVKVQVQWSLGADGFFQVFCNEEPIYVLRGQTLVPPGCGTDAKPNCRTELLQHNNPIVWQIGPLFRGFGSDWADYGRSSSFLPLPSNGVNIRVRNLYQGEFRQ